MLKHKDFSDILCDLRDIKRQAQILRFGKMPKDNDGSIFTINDCLDNCIEILEGLQNA